MVFKQLNTTYARRRKKQRHLWPARLVHTWAAYSTCRAVMGRCSQSEICKEHVWLIRTEIRLKLPKDASNPWCQLACIGSSPKIQPTWAYFSCNFMATPMHSLSIALSGDERDLEQLQGTCVTHLAADIYQGSCNKAIWESICRHGRQATLCVFP